jgi:hypothetical protein
VEPFATRVPAPDVVQMWCRRRGERVHAANMLVNEWAVEDLNL